MAYPPLIGERVTLRGVVSTVYLKRNELMGVEWQSAFEWWVEEGFAEIIPGLVPSVEDLFVTVKNVKSVMGETITPEFVEAVNNADSTLAAVEAAAARAEQAAADTESHVVGVPAGGWPRSQLATDVTTSLSKADTAAQTTDPRFTDARNPVVGSVTDASVAAGAGIALSKLATGRVSGAVNGAASTTILNRLTQAQYDALATKDPNTWYAVI